MCLCGGGSDVGLCVCVYKRSYMLRCDKAMLLLEVITNLKNLPLTVSGT